MPKAALAVGAVVAAAIVGCAAALLGRRPRNARRWDCADGPGSDCIQPDCTDLDPIDLPDTMFGPTCIYAVEDDAGDPVRVLEVGGICQSATYLDERYTDPVFAYDRAFDLAFDGVGARPDRVLMIGGGGFAYPKHFVATRPAGHIDVVEIDPAIIAIARRYFFVDRLMREYDADGADRLGIICADGREYLEKCADVGSRAECCSDRCADRCAGRYNVIINDSFKGGVPASRLMTVEAARSARECLTPGGLYMANAVSALEGDGARMLRAVAAALAQVFAHVYAVPCASGGDFGPSAAGGLACDDEPDNVMVVACDAELSLPGMRAVAWGPDDPVLTDACVDDVLPGLLPEGLSMRA